VRAEYFNVFNHAMFGLPDHSAHPMISGLTRPDTSIQTLARYVPRRTSTKAAARGEGDKALSTAAYARRSSLSNYSSSRKQRDDLKVTQSQLRHTTPKITLELYAQAISADQHKAHKKVVQMVLPARFPEKLQARAAHETA